MDERLQIEWETTMTDIELALEQHLRKKTIEISPKSPIFSYLLSPTRSKRENETV